DPANHEHLLAAHGLLMAGLIDAPGRFRRGGVGIYRGDQLVQMAPPAARVPSLVDDLLTWLAASTWHPLLVSCVAHYELEFIHPFALEAIHDALRSEIGSEMSSEIGATPAAAIDALILRDLATEPTLSARRLAERLQLSQRAVEKHLAALQQKGRLRRHGSPRAGHWQVL
ncbi:MAG: Fic family protein, partial [Cyanobacteriota bacterium]